MEIGAQESTDTEQKQETEKHERERDREREREGGMLLGRGLRVQCWFFASLL